MNIKVQIVIESENGKPEVVHEVAQLKREALRVEEFGLTENRLRSSPGFGRSLISQPLCQANA